jgi:hypothetical protein
MRYWRVSETSAGNASSCLPRILTASASAIGRPPACAKPELRSGVGRLITVSSLAWASSAVMSFDRTATRLISRAMGFQTPVLHPPFARDSRHALFARPSRAGSSTHAQSARDMAGRQFRRGARGAGFREKRRLEPLSCRRLARLAAFDDRPEQPRHEGRVRLARSDLVRRPGGRRYQPAPALTALGNPRSRSILGRSGRDRSTTAPRAPPRFEIHAPRRWMPGNAVS